MKTTNRNKQAKQSISRRLTGHGNLRVGTAGALLDILQVASLIALLFVAQTLPAHSAELMSADALGNLTPVISASAVNPTSKTQTVPGDASAAFLATSPLQAAAVATPPTYGPNTAKKVSDIRALPSQSNGLPKATYVAPAGALATGSEGARGVSVYVETRTQGWAGGGFTYDNYITTAVKETGDLRNISELTFGLKGVFDRVKMEVIDINNNKWIAYLTGIRNDVEQVWTVSKSAIQGVDLAKITTVYFIVEGQNRTGLLEINQLSIGSSYPRVYQSSTEITRLPGNPANNRVIPSGATGTMTNTSRGFRLNYNTGNAGWAGAGFNYDNFATSTIETGNLSGYSSLIFGIKGTHERVKLEVIDDQNRKAVAYLRQIYTGYENEWKVDTADLLVSGVNLARVRHLYFIVEGVNISGTLEVNRVPTDVQPNLAAKIQPLPGYPVMTQVYPTGANASTVQTDAGMRINYNTGTPGWAGGGWKFDNPFTNAVETADLTKPEYYYLGFGIKGNTTSVKIEVVDINNRKGSVILSGIRNDLSQRHAVPMVTLAAYGVDLTKVKTIYFIVEGANKTGSLEIERFTAMTTVSTPDGKWSLNVDNEDIVIKKGATFKGRMPYMRQEYPASPILHRAFLSNQYAVTMDFVHNGAVPGQGYLEIKVIKFGAEYVDSIRITKISVPATLPNGQADLPGYAYNPFSGIITGDMATFTLLNGQRYQLTLSGNALGLTRI